MTLEAQKAAARKVAFARRKVAFDTAAPAACGVLSELLAGHRGVPLAGYVPIRTEIDPLAAMAEASAYGPVGVPVIQGAGLPLQFSQWEPDMPLRDGFAFAAQEAEALPLEETDQPLDMIVTETGVIQF